MIWVNLVLLLLLLNFFWRRRVALIDLTQQLFILRRPSFGRFAWPRWQSAIAVTLTGVLTGFNLSLRSGTNGISSLPLGLSIPFSLLAAWAGLLLTVALLQWWMRCGGRWNGEGDLFNLVVAAGLITSVLGAGLLVLQAPQILFPVLAAYAVLVTANALAGAVPKAGLAYALSGVVLSMVLVMLAWLLLGGVAGFLMFALRLGSS